MHFLEEIPNENETIIVEEEEKGTLIVLATFIILSVGAIVK